MLTNFDLKNIAKIYDIKLIDVCIIDKLLKRVNNGNYIL